VNTENFTLTTEIKVAGAATGFKGLQTVLSDNTEEAQSGGILSRSYDRQDWFVLHEGDKTRVNINREKGAAQTASSVEVTALSSHYFALAIADHSDLLPSFETSMAPLAPMAVGRLTYRPLNPADTFNVKYVGYAGPKSYNTLSTIDARLANVIDYGMFAIIARPLLLLMRFLFSVFGNWGVAIIVLTILVRLVVLPFNIFSTKSMKAMQRIQPEMNRIKERYKDKPADQKIQMNQEIMALMKQNKANPIGGCLPMLLQLPVFFALYQVLGQSIELYRAPFMLWIQDLSAKDPFFVLPALMGITMFVQQRITPSAMDPQQAKVMMWMPVIFTVFMVSLPSGLTLYIFVSTLFAIIQQFVLMRDRSPAGTIKEARA
jgi:YidC/Oxa1 family membrane protein insertase